MLARIQECILYRNFSNGEILNDMTELINLYESDEEALKAALIGAQKQGKLVIAEAEETAKKIIADANYEADRIIGSTRIDIVKEKECLEKMKQEVSDFKSNLLDMYREQKTGDSFSDRIICSILTLFFVELTRRHGNNVSIPDSRRDRTQQESEMLAYMIGNCSTVTLNKLAEEFHFSVPYCSKLIKSITGKTFSNLLTEIRLQQGEQLLLYSQLSVEDISDKVGYRNPESFIRAFRQLHNDTPSQYRRKNK